MSEKYIMHYGIPKQKWGIRRFQNADGTYTEEGKRRRRKYSDDYINYKNLKKKNYKEMSNKELNEYNNRANLERNYRNLKFNSNTIAKGMAFLGTVSATIILANNLYNNSNTLAKNIEKLVSVGKDYLNSIPYLDTL
jgi:hypothetical protein